MNYSEAVDYIGTVYWTERKRGLYRIEQLAKNLDNPEKDLYFIHIAGTNGKGSVSAMLEKIFRCAGYKTGLFTSPHLLKYNERIKINGYPISDEDFAKYADQIKTASDLMTEAPTVFEKLTAMGMLAFRENKCNIVILEVGMGGEFDSTNYIKSPVLSVISTIDYDHTAMLGNTLPEIASAKAGIIKKGCPAVVMNQAKEVLDVFLAKTDLLQSKLYVSDDSDVTFVRYDGFRQLLKIHDFHDLAEFNLAGKYQRKNLSLVLKAINVFNLYCDRINLQSVDKDSILNALKTVRWDARFEVINTNPVFIIDGAHNPQGITAAVDSLDEMFPNKKVKFIMGVMQDKDYPKMLEILSKKADTIYAISSESERALPAEKLAEIISAYDVTAIVCNNYKSAVDLAMSDAKEDTVICSLGSLYLAGDIRRLFNDYQ